MRLTTKGQVTVPKHIRDKLGLGPGDDVGFREEGLARKYLLINGAWADHVLFGMLEEEAPAKLRP